MADSELVSVRYLVDDVEAAVDFYTRHFDFTVADSHVPAFADVRRGNPRATPEGSATPGRNRVHLVVPDLDLEAERLGSAGVPFRSEVVEGPGGRQVLVADPAGNLVEVFQPVGC